MKRTSIDLDPEMALRLRAEASRRGVTMMAVIREALEEYLGAIPSELPPGAGSFRSGRDDTARRAEGLLSETHFGQEP